MKFWVLTETYNEYDQYGDYFIAVWKDKPTLKQLAKITGAGDINNQKLLDIGTNVPERRSGGESWYNLFEQKEGIKN